MATWGNTGRDWKTSGTVAGALAVHTGRIGPRSHLPQPQPPTLSRCPPPTPPEGWEYCMGP